MTVFLVGAGPGDPGLLTVRGAEVLSRADVVVHDRLADSRLLDLAPAGARRIDVGKSPGGPVDQNGINDLLVQEGRAHGVVVRLKGGDPFVFGRGGEEALALREAGLHFEVVPGITSAVAVPAYAGVPVTHRALSTSFTVVTGHSRHAVDRETNWQALAQAGGTIVVLMGVAHRGSIAERLMDAGLDPQTPVAAIRWGTRPEQTSVRTHLGDLGATPLEPPATIVIGNVARLDLAWYEARPLFGKRIIVTRARTQASQLIAMLNDLGARTIEVPTIAIEPPSDGGAGLDRAALALARGEYSAVVFTSPNAVDPLLSRVEDIRSLSGCIVAAVGPATAQAISRHRTGIDVTPEHNLAEGLLQVFPPPPSPGAPLLFPRAAEGREVLVEGLADAGWRVDLVEAYRTVKAVVPAELHAEIREADAVAFTSSSTVIGFVDACGLDAVPQSVVCIGPVTGRTAREIGIEVDAIATTHDLPGLVDALIAALA